MEFPLFSLDKSANDATSYTAPPCTEVIQSNQFCTAPSGQWQLTSSQQSESLGDEFYIRPSFLDLPRGKRRCGAGSRIATVLPVHDMFSMESGNERLGQPSSQSYFNPDPGFPESISCVGERSSIWEDFPSANPTTASDRIDPEAKQMSRTRLGTNCDMNEQYIPTGVSTLEMRGEKPQKFLLACPFFRKDVQKYRNCMKFMLHRVKDVKQHLQRHHMKPDFYCARCFKVFATSQARDQHSRDIQCPCKEGPKFDGISEQQQKRLSRNSNRGRDIDVQWFEMWDIIFPGHARPRTCYLGDYGEEFVSHLRSFWTKEKSDIWRIALEGNASEFDPDFCDRVMNVMFARFELEMSSSDHDKNEQPRQAKRACVRRHLKPATGGENKVDEEPWLKGDSGNISPQLELHVPKRN